MTDSHAATPTPREMSIDDALAFAVEMLRDGNTNDGLKLCDRILEVAPEHASALHFRGLGLHQTGRFAEAIASIERALVVAPRYTDAWNNLGNMLLQAERVADAEVAYRKVLEIEPQHADAWNNLGTALKEQDRLEEAEAAARKALELQPAHADAHHTLGNVLRLRKRPHEALEAFKQAILLRPQHPDSYRGLGAALYAVGQIEEAAEVYRRWVALEPENPYPQHLLAACTQQAIPERASDAFVASTFDRFANSFDKVLSGLQYRAPALLAQAIEEYLGPPAPRFDVADAGCGTGLCGPLLRPWARTLDGVDLSKAMVNHARDRKVGDAPAYDELTVAELTAHFFGRPACYDLVVSADTLCYFGRLEAPVESLARALRPNGLLAFTVERADEAHAPDGFAIHPHGRYSQTETYVRRVLKGAGLSPKLIACVHLRLEKAKPVDGLLVLAKKQGRAS
ncbi:MAG: tetratricopeptide repeat protein [Myxococcales bacterium]|nr:tetratricopeptide repeat protein [Myxococcales bacterium]